MVEGFILKYNKREGLFCKIIREVGGFLIEYRKRQGVLCKSACLLPPLSRGIGEGAALQRRPETGVLGLDSASGGGGKGRGE